MLWNFAMYTMSCVSCVLKAVVMQHLDVDTHVYVMCLFVFYKTTMSLSMSSYTPSTYADICTCFTT